jgi:hypothetical protein
MNRASEVVPIINKVDPVEERLFRQLYAKRLKVHFQQLGFISHTSAPNSHIISNNLILMQSRKLLHSIDCTLAQSN